MKFFKQLQKFFVVFLFPICASAVMLRLSFTRIIPGTLIFFALVPVCVACRKWTRRQSALGFFLTGLLFYFLLLYWISRQTTAGMIALVIYCSLYFIPFGILLGNHGNNLVSIRSKIALSFLFIILEYIRSHLYAGFPWALFGTALHKETILIQLADLTGVYGISFIVIFVNLMIASLFIYTIKAGIKFILKLRYLYIHTSLLLFIFSFLIIYGETRLIQPLRKKRIPLQIGLIQPNVDSETKWNLDEKNRLIAQYKKLSLGLRDIDLLIWPESVLPGELFYDSKLFSALVEIIEERQVPVLLGSGNISFETIFENGRTRTKEIFYNSAYLVGKDGKIKGIYNKIILVPFGEYIPLKELFPQARHLTPITESYHPGHQLTVFSLEKERARIPFSAVICIEDIYPHLIRRFVNLGALFIVNVTNDGWYSFTPCAYQHFSLSIFRAVENRRPLVRCANTGVSAIISPQGEIAHSLSQGHKLTDVPGILKGEIFVERDQKKSFYTKYGDAFIGFSALAVLAYLFQDKIYSFLRMIKRRHFRKNSLP
ncbi:MAG: apolipoprotein N-acyltransferase [Candidatus Aureabacteria bacterium]|nr:apolipoprotein N-acyltransferase [Candidatus Auribacterota bacterium]